MRAKRAYRVAGLKIMVLTIALFPRLEFCVFSVRGKYCIFKSLVQKVEGTERINVYY